MYNEHYEKRNFCLAGKEPAFIIKCDSCGAMSIVSAEHKRYCPVCGPSAITPLTVAPYSEDNKTVFHAFHRDFARQLETIADDNIFEDVMDSYCGNCDYPSDCAEDENGMDDIARLNDPTYYMGKDCEECAIRALYNERIWKENGANGAWA